MQSTINVGFLIIPIIMAVIAFFLRQMKAECDFAVKCFKILPRKFIMKISMSKKLKNIGILDEIEMVAAWNGRLDLIDINLSVKSYL